MRKIKIAEFFGEPLNYGGQEAFALNVYSKINKSNFEFTFITPFECQNKSLVELVKQNKDNLIFDNNNFETKLRKKYILQTAKRYLKSNYDIVHIHSGSVFTLYHVAKIAKKNGIKKIIVHSHATGINNFKYKIIKFLSDSFIDKYADLYFACSLAAGKWKFPKKIIDSNKFYVIKNGIDIDKFKFNTEIRNKYREHYQLKNKHIICAIGRYAKEKNPLFTLRTFSNYLKIDKKAFLVMIGGSGDLESEIYNYIKSNKLEKYVLILKNRNDINSFLSMSDLFIMPSLWEGLGISAIESQASGIPTLCSENIPNDVKISKLFNKKYLSDGEEEWAKEIAKLIKMKREDVSNLIRKSGFDINETVKIIENFYSEV